ncbi:MAG TPA: hypothetical protein PKY87_01270, partial [Terricaulis sp.]|nr:hypothetical protein [Terricaulis sp.]
RGSERRASVSAARARSFGPRASAAAIRSSGEGEAPLCVAKMVKVAKLPVANAADYRQIIL